MHRKFHVVVRYDRVRVVKCPDQPMGPKSSPECTYEGDTCVYIYTRRLLIEHGDWKITIGTRTQRSYTLQKLPS